VKFRRSSDLAEVQGGYGEEDSEEFQAQERQNRQFRATGAVRSTRGIVYRGFMS
jgi:hypothetical protein